MIDKVTATHIKERAQKAIIPDSIFFDIEAAARRGLGSIDVAVKDIEDSGKDIDLIVEGLKNLGYTTNIRNDSVVLFPEYILEIQF